VDFEDEIYKICEYLNYITNGKTINRLKYKIIILFLW